MEIEEIEQKMKQEWSLLYLIVDIFEKIEQGSNLTKAKNTPIPGVKVVNITYLLILRTGRNVH